MVSRPVTWASIYGLCYSQHERPSTSFGLSRHIDRSSCGCCCCPCWRPSHLHRTFTPCLLLATCTPLCAWRSFWLALAAFRSWRLTMARSYPTPDSDAAFGRTGRSVPRYRAKFLLLESLLHIELQKSKQFVRLSCC